MSKKKIYIASSFRHIHAVQLLERQLITMGYEILDWTRKASVPEGLTPAQRREWMDTDNNGGTVFAFCHESCTSADLVIYLGQSGQDAGVEIGMAKASNIPVLGIRGPLEYAGLMLYGSCTTWVDSIGHALLILERLASCDVKDFTKKLVSLKKETKAEALKLAD